MEWTILSSIRNREQRNRPEYGRKRWLIGRMPCENETFGGPVKRIAIAVTALLILAVAAPLSAAERNDIVDEVIRMWKANVAEETIIQFVAKSDARFRVSADDVIDMADAKVPRTVIKAVLDEADARGDRSRPAERVQTRTVYVPSYYGGYYGRSFYNPWYYDPFWYGPRISVGFRFGGGWGHYYGGRHFRGRHR